LQSIIFGSSLSVFGEVIYLFGTFGIKRIILKRFWHTSGSGVALIWTFFADRETIKSFKSLSIIINRRIFIQFIKVFWLEKTIKI
jgi:hypothetical protein